MTDTGHDQVHEISDDDSFGSDFDSAAEDVLSVTDRKDEDLNQRYPVLSSTHPDPDSSQPTQPDITRRPNSLTPGEESQALRSSILSATSMCVICKVLPAYNVGPNIFPTCGYTCASKLQARSGLPNPNHTRTSLAHSTPSPSSPPSLFGALTSAVGWIPEPTTYASHPRSQSRPNQLKMCDVCHIRPRCQRGGKMYPTCGLSCAAKLHAPGSIEMCDYCKKRPKVVINGKIYPQCGKTCRDKAKLAETAANAAACISCILCFRSTKAGESDFCSRACQSLADARAPFLIEIPRGHVAFKKVAQIFTSGWQKSHTHCPTVKRVYMFAMKPSFNTSYDRYRTKIGSGGILQRKANQSQRWLVISRECGFGDPGDVEPCSSAKCFLCCIVRSSFSRFDFPTGITTSSLNRAVEFYRSGKKSSLKIAVLTHVIVGREAEMTSQEMQVVHPIPPQGSDSVHIIGVRHNGSKVDMDDIVVYDGDAVKPVYLIAYE